MRTRSRNLTGPRARRLYGAIAAVSLAIALLLPFPGPHVDRYVPVARVLARRELLEADRAFFLLLFAIVGTYFAAAFAVLAIAARIVRRRRSDRPAA